ncbi:MAG: hypothetical protein HY554_06200 [Elusimicrobia bacterium]|nr:hypothetical protein [Elusimicrobiota bacterium]
MKRPRKEGVLAGACLALALWGGPARAQRGSWSLEKPPEDYEGPSWALSYDSGYAAPGGPDAPSVEPSVLFQASLERQVASALAAGLELGHQFGHKLKGELAGRYPVDGDGDGQRDFVRFDSDVKVKVFHLAPYARLGKVFGRRGGLRLKHTVSVGAGLYYRTWNEGTLTLFGPGSAGALLDGRNVDFGGSRSTHFGVSFGSALDFLFREGMSLGAELRYHNLFDPLHDIGYLVPTLRITFLF